MNKSRVRVEGAVAPPCVFKRYENTREGAIAVFAAVMMVVVFGMVAFAIDLGYLTTARTEAQRTADATCHAAIIEFARTRDVEQAIERAHVVASEFTSENLVLGEVAAVTRDIDVTVGRYEFGSGQTDLLLDDRANYNAVKVKIRRTADQNGAVPLFFAGIFNKRHQELESEAIAALVRNVKGFKIPPSGINAPILPITVKESAWTAAFEQGQGNDNWAYHSENGTVSEGSDGSTELVMFPEDTGSSGNLGTVNIGISANSAAYLGAQIRNGLSKSDFDYHGGTLELDAGGQLELSGNPGLTASIKDDLQSIVGQVRVIPVYRKVSGNGNNAKFKIVKFVAVRMMASKLTGNDKAVTVQPASMIYNGIVQGSESGQSEGIYSAPRIVR